MRILGVDPGLLRTGYSVLDCAKNAVVPKLIDAGIIRLTAKTTVAARLVELESELNDLMDETKPQACAVEKLYAHYKHPMTAILMGHARGVILLCIQRRGIELIELSANRIKKNLTGHGHASKAQMQRSVQQVFKLKKLPEPADVADAIAIALCAARG